ncbi:hypothetical protein [Sellimonas intestinalis]|uniref:hypothetical protein n=1 Tax=Sellimonas intestinalis TaxID=1653434 RepID=UPI0039908435
MAIENKRMQQRYGTYSKFQIEKSKLLPNEFASVTSGDPKSSDGKGLYFAFAPGEAKQLMTYEDGKQMIDGATDEIKEGFLDDINEATTAANSATSKANAAASNADIKAQEAANAAEDARGVIDQITKDSYLHTTTQTFVDTVKASPTAYGNAIPEQIEGYIKQDTTKGLQLFDAKTVLSSQIQSKVLTCNNDGSVTLDGEITGSNRNFTIQLSAGTYYFNEKDKIFHTLVNGDDLWNKPYTFETDTTIKCYIANGEYGNKKIYPMINKGDSPLSIEPYTGGQPSPNPDYPQIVHGVGDMGFFDGELLQGYYQVSDGTFKPATVALCNKNPIPCKPGDKIIFEYEDVINGSGISIFFYKSDGTFISRVNKVGVRKIEGVAPQDTTYCNIVINPVSEPIPVASAKHITVTINDKYAVCVKSKGKNLLNLTGEILYSFGRETIFDNQVTIRPTTDGRSAPGVWFVLGDIKKFLGKTIYVKADAIQRSGNYNPRMLLMTIKGNTSVRTYLTYSYSKAGQVMSVKIPDDLDTNEASDLALNMYVNDGSSQVDADAYAIFTNVYAGLSEPTNEFVPYQSNVTYIPVDYPLFEGDKIVRRNGEYKLLRKWKQEVFDGSEDEGWVQGKSNTNQFYTSQYKEKKVNADIVSNRFKHATSVEPPSIWIGNDINIYFESGYLDNNTIAGFQEWLQENPVSCVYELATPTEEPLSSEAMKALYSIMACDEETELTIVGVPSDAEIQNQFLLPRNEDGALNTTAYCTAKRNEIALEELVSQSLDARVNKLEVDNESLNLQTLIVE